MNSNSLSKRQFCFASALLTILFLLASSSFSAEYKADLDFTEPVSGIDRIYVESLNGDIKLTAAQTTTVLIKAHIEVEGDQEAVDEYAKLFRTEITRSDGRLVVKTIHPENEREFDGEIERASISYDISLPPEFGAKAETVNGDIGIVGLTGDLDAGSVNGDLTYKVEGVSGGEIQAETVNGDMEIDVPDLKGKSSFESVNGEVNIRMTGKLAAGLKAETVNGSITIRVPKAASFSLESEVAVSGSIETDWGEGKSAEYGPGESLEVDVNGGGEKVSLETVNGSIEVHVIK